MFLCPTLKKGAYCFAPIGWYVDKLMSAQYLLNPVLESCQTWYSECLYGVDDPFWFSGPMVKRQGQTAGLCSNVVCSISLDPFAGKLPNLKQWMSLESRWSLLISWSHYQRSSLNCWSLFRCCLLNISWPLCWKVAKLITVNAF